MWVRKGQYPDRETLTPARLRARIRPTNLVFCRRRHSRGVTPFGGSEGLGAWWFCSIFFPFEALWTHFLSHDPVPPQDRLLILPTLPTGRGRVVADPTPIAEYVPRHSLNPFLLSLPPGRKTAPVGFPEGLKTTSAPVPRASPARQGVVVSGRNWPRGTRGISTFRSVGSPSGPLRGGSNSSTSG
jgi:hypothetical protein